jgi:hypothetical protein
MTAAAPLRYRRPFRKRYSSAVLILAVGTEFCGWEDGGGET